MNFRDFLLDRYPLLRDRDLTSLHWELATVIREAEAWHAGEVKNAVITQPHYVRTSTEPCAGCGHLKDYCNCHD